MQWIQITIRRTESRLESVSGGGLDNFDSLEAMVAEYR